MQDSIIQRHTTQATPTHPNPIHNYLPNRIGGEITPHSHHQAGRRASSGHNTMQDSIIQRHTTQATPTHPNPIHNYLPNRIGGEITPHCHHQAGVLLQGTTPRKTASYNVIQPKPPPPTPTRYITTCLIE